MNNIFKNPTLFSISCSLGIIIFFLMGIYALTWKGGESLYAISYFVMCAILLIVYSLDRTLSKYINNLKISLFELLFLIIAIPLFLISISKVFIELKNNNENFILIIENTGQLKNDKYLTTFPLDKNIITNKNYIIIDKIPDKIYFTRPDSWNGSYKKTLNFKKYHKIEMYLNSDYDYNYDFGINESYIDSIINK